MVSRKSKKIKEADQATHEFYQRELDGVFVPAKRKALAKKLDLTEDAILDELQTISEQTQNEVERVKEKFTLELEQFYKESVNEFIIKEDAIDAEIEEKHPTVPLTKEEELAGALKLMKDKYTDKNGVLNENKLSKFFMSNPDILKSIGGDMGSITDSVDSENEPHVSDSFISSELGIPFNSGRTDKIIAEKDIEIDKQKEEIALKNKLIADYFVGTVLKKPKKGKNNKDYPVQNYIKDIGKVEYRTYCKEQGLKKGDKICMTTHLEDFHDNEKYRARIKARLGERGNYKEPDIDGTTWRNKIQKVVLKAMGIQGGGKSRNRKGNQNQF